MNYTATVRTHPPPLAASTLYFTLGDDEEMLDAGERPAPLSEVAGPLERPLRHIVAKIMDFCAGGADPRPSCAADGGC